MATPASPPPQLPWGNVILTDVPGGTATCPAGYQPLTSSWEDCRDAAISLGYSGDAVAHVDYFASSCGLWGTNRPQGCFLSLGGELVVS